MELGMSDHFTTLDHPGLPGLIDLHVQPSAGCQTSKVRTIPFQTRLLIACLLPQASCDPLEGCLWFDMELWCVRNSQYSELR